MSKAALTTLDAFVKAQVSKLEEYIGQIYGLDNFKVIIKYTRKERSWGGVNSGGFPFIELGIPKYINAIDTNTLTYFHEYTSFSGDKNIGSLFNVTWQQALGALIAHEVAHAVQYYNPTKIVKSKYAGHNLGVNEFRAHKRLWKLIYADLRGYILPQCVNTQTTVAPKSTQATKKKIITKRFVLDKNLEVITYNTEDGILVGKTMKKDNDFFIWNSNTKEWVGVTFDVVVETHNQIHNQYSAS